MTNPRTDHEPRARLDPREVEVPGDLHAPDLVSPVGEEMPVQTHDEVDASPDEQPPAQERHRRAAAGDGPL